eukprot:962443-Prymnesium_polylepis.1
MLHVIAPGELSDSRRAHVDEGRRKRALIASRPTYSRPAAARTRRADGVGRTPAGARARRIRS